MSSRKSTFPFKSGANKGSFTLFAFAVLLLNCIASSSSLSTSTSSEKADSSIPVRNEGTAVTGEDAEHQGLEFSSLAKRASRTYNFGLGKRELNGSPSDLLFNREKLIEFLRQNNLILPKANYAEGPSAMFAAEPFGIKRSKPQRFSFGLGKRMEEAPMPEEEEESALENSSPEDTEGSRNKRKADRYQFGLGKRAPFYWFSMGPRSAARGIDEFKRRYNFGLGK